MERRRYQPDRLPRRLRSPQGYQELFEIEINSLDGSVDFLHFDLFTIVGAGQLGATDQVYQNAAFTHDAQTVPEPASAALLALDLVGLAAARSRPR